VNTDPPQRARGVPSLSERPQWRALQQHLGETGGPHLREQLAQEPSRREPGNEALPYERFLRDAILGDPSLFTRDDSVEAAWRVVEPVLGSTGPVQEYAPGRWGPDAAARVVHGDKGWHDPQPEESAPC
jgi:glucose-6-phosphate 1-dehydrogenase